jgi:GWxTD domain-containing protein
MSSVMRLLDQPQSLAAGWTLVHFVWEGALIAILAGALKLALPRPAARLRYAVHCGALLLMVVAAVATYCVSFDGRLPNGGIALSGLGAVMPARILAPGPAVGTSMATILPWVTAFWLLGVLALSVRWAGGWLLLRRKLKAGREAAPPEWIAVLARLRQRLMVSRPVALYQSVRAAVPATVGWLRPVIIVPTAAFCGLSGAQLEAILAHELAHIRRHDYLVNLLQTVTETLLFYHPAVWWVSREIRRERENCCDDVAAEACGDRLLYAQALVALEDTRSAWPQPALAATGGVLKARIERLLRPRGGSHAVAPAGFAVLLGALLIALWSATTLTAQQLESPYAKWLSEDVVYIITPAERAEFQGLKTDEQRKQFIEEFWLKRDPAYKQEHYRRIAYANERFRDERPGWQTDRGRTYIRFGPPDEISSRIELTSRTGDVSGTYVKVEVRHSTREIWTYSHIEGAGDNITFQFDLR